MPGIDGERGEVMRLETETMEKAAKHVANMLQRPDQLDKVEQLVSRVKRKKASVEAMLKTAMQSQLDGVRTGLNHLETALSDMKEINGCITEMETNLEAIPDMYQRLAEVREENLRHSQLATARENLKHIFTVPETVEKTKLLIQEGKLLQAHQFLVDLENSRDDLLFELHRLGHSNTEDKDLLKEYFEAVDDLSALLEKHLGVIMLRAFATVRKNPHELVTALRIIEREERTDEDCLYRQRQTGYIPPGRPKEVKIKCLKRLHDCVSQKIEANQLEIREENKMWLVRHLEVIRIIMLEDLRLAKHHFVPCFPPKYNIFQYCMSLYHTVVADRIQTIIDEGLEGQEYVSLLQWVEQTYPGPELMGSSALNIEKPLIPALLNPEVVESLMNMYLENMRENYASWMQNAIDLEKSDWMSDKDPEVDMDGYISTASPVTIYQMVDENLQVSATISQDLVYKVLLLGIEQVSNFGRLYRSAIIDFKSAYFQDRKQFGQYTRYMIAIINNCDRFEELSQDMKERWWKAGHHDNHGLAKHEHEQLLRTYQEIREWSVDYLLDEAFLDIEAFFGDLFTTRWQGSSQAVETICFTLKDYFQDYQFLKPKNLHLVILNAQNRVAKKYITSMLQPNLLKRKISPVNEQDRRNVAIQIKQEAGRCKLFFKDVKEMAAGGMEDYDSPFDTITLLAEVLAADLEMMSLDLGTLCQRYPDITNDQVFCLLLLRGDMASRQEAQKMAEDYVKEGGHNKPLHAKSIFSQVTVSASLNPFSN